MAVLKSNDNKNFIVSCKCGCDEGIRFEIVKDKYDDYAFMTYMNGSFYREQEDTMWNVFCKKMKKIFAIIRNKDFYYAEVLLEENDFKEFKKYLNSIY